MDRRQQGIRWRGAENPAELFAQLVPVERRNRQRRHPRSPQELTQRRSKTAICICLVRPVGPDDQQFRVTRHVGEVQEERPTGWVGPMDVLQLQDDRSLDGRAVQDVDEPLEEPGLGEARKLLADGRPIGVLGEFWKDAGENGPIRTDERFLLHWVEGAEQVPQRLDDRGVGRSSFSEIKARPCGDSSAALARALIPSVEKARLSDAGVATDQDGRGVPLRCRLEGFVECRQLGGASDEGGARGSDHRPILRPECRAAVVPDGRLAPGLE